MEQKVILVDEEDHQIGLEGKLKAHKEGHLHRAISVYIFNSKGEILMQQRAAGKYHSGLLWSNTCCGNCYEGETAELSAHRSLKDEMGIECKLKEEFSIIYMTEVGGGLTEHEYLHVFFGRYDKDPKTNPEEVNDWKWISLNDLLSDVKKNPAKYSNWLKILLSGELPKQIEKFLSNGR